MASNAHAENIDGLADESSRFDQSALSPEDGQKILDEYFAIVPDRVLNPEPHSAVFRAGSGRWAVVASRVKSLACACVDRLKPGVPFLVHLFSVSTTNRAGTPRSGQFRRRSGAW